MILHHYFLIFLAQIALLQHFGTFLRARVPGVAETGSGKTLAFAVPALLHVANQVCGGFFGLEGG